MPVQASAAQGAGLSTRPARTCCLGPVGCTWRACTCLEAGQPSRQQRLVPEVHAQLAEGGSAGCQVPDGPLWA